MIVLDANLLLYAYDETAANHARARDWLVGILSGEEIIGLPCQTVGAFLRIATNSGLTGQRFTTQEAVNIVEEWLDHPLMVLLAPGDGHWQALRQALIDGQARGPLITDAQLAALTIENGGVLYSSDRDFARFPGLRWVNPLAVAP